MIKYCIYTFYTRFVLLRKLIHHITLNYQCFVNRICTGMWKLGKYNLLVSPRIQALNKVHHLKIYVKGNLNIKLSSVLHCDYWGSCEIPNETMQLKVQCKWTCPTSSGTIRYWYLQPNFKGQIFQIFVDLQTLPKCTRLHGGLNF